MERLVYRRQFLLINSEIKELNHWQYKNIDDNIHLYVHPDLNLTYSSSKTFHIIMLGNIFDPNDPQKGDNDIISDLSLKIESFNELISSIRSYAGRYVFIYKDHFNFCIFHDPLGLREIYYCTKPNRVICGSQPNMLAVFSMPKLEITNNKKILNFYENDLNTVRSGRLWVGDETLFCSIKHLMPNHYLNIYKLKVNRYWPNRKIERIDLNIAVKLTCSYLKGVMDAITSRFQVMMAVTSGMDSRSLLAASKDLKSKIYFFVNKHPHLKSSAPDIRLPKAMMESLRIPFHIHCIEKQVDEEFKKIFLNNVFMSSELLLPAIYNVYFKNHQEKVNILGVGEIGREYYGDEPVELDGYYLAHCLKYRSSVYATEQCENWLNQTRDVAKIFNIDIMKMFLWECLLGNWGCVGNSESDIAIEEFDPYDSHYVYEIMLSVDPKHGDLFIEMYKAMWPELLDFPFNPPETKKDSIILLMKKIGMYNILKKLRFYYERWKYNKLLIKRNVATHI